MPDFSYVAINRDGKQIKGSMQASDVASVKSKLRMDGMTPVSIKAQSILTRDIQLGSGKVKTRDLSVFCRQFSSILNAGVTVVEALRMLAEQTESVPLRKALYKTKELVQQGSTLAEAMSKSPKVFNEMFVSMVEAGEASGNLELCISRMGTQFEKSAKIASLVRGALTYPIAVIVVAIVVVMFMSLKVIPKFAEMYEGIDMELPGSTRSVLALSDALMNYWWLMAIIVAILAAFFKWSATTKRGKEIYGAISLKLPIFGQINLKSNSARFSRTMSTLVSSGMGITQAIEITANTMTNILYRQALEHAKTEVEQGVPLSVPIRKSSVFPNMVHNMLAIGEETGSIEHMLDKVADYYEEETEAATKTLADLLQPLIIVILGGIIGWMVLAMYQPMIGMYGGMGNL